MITEKQSKNKKRKHKGPGKGWHGDPKGHAKAGAIGGKAWKKDIKNK